MAVQHFTYPGGFMDWIDSQWSDDPEPEFQSRLEGTGWVDADTGEALPVEPATRKPSVILPGPGASFLDYEARAQLLSDAELWDEFSWFDNTYDLTGIGDEGFDLPGEDHFRLLAMWGEASARWGLSSQLEDVAREYSARGLDSGLQPQRPVYEAAVRLKEVSA